MFPQSQVQVIQSQSQQPQGVRIRAPAMQPNFQQPQHQNQFGSSLYSGVNQQQIQQHQFAVNAGQQMPMQQNNFLQQQNTIQNQQHIQVQQQNNNFVDLSGPQYGTPQQNNMQNQMFMNTNQQNNANQQNFQANVYQQNNQNFVQPQNFPGQQNL